MIVVIFIKTVGIIIKKLIGLGCQGTGVQVPILTGPKDDYTNCLQQLVSCTTTYTHNLYYQPALTSEAKLNFSRWAEFS